VRVLGLHHQERKSVSIQVLAGIEGHVGLQGAFVIAARHGQPSIVYLEDAADGRVTDDPALVEQVTLRFKSLQTTALSVRASRDLIARMAEEQCKASALTGGRAHTALVTAEPV
jgi:hypothetical protein